MKLKKKDKKSEKLSKGHKSKKIKKDKVKKKEKIDSKSSEEIDAKKCEEEKYQSGTDQSQAQKSIPFARRANGGQVRGGLEGQKRYRHGGKTGQAKNQIGQYLYPFGNKMTDNHSD